MLAAVVECLQYLPCCLLIFANIQIRVGSTLRSIHGGYAVSGSWFKANCHSAATSTYKAGDNDLPCG